MKVEEIRIMHCLARKNGEGQWNCETNRYVKRDNGTMYVPTYQTELEAIDVERKIRKERNKKWGMKTEECLYICSGENPYSDTGLLFTCKYSSKTSYQIDDRPIMDILKELVTNNSIKDNEWLQISCL